MRTSPSCQCCFTCEVAIEDAGGPEVIDNEDSGSFSYASGVYSTSTANSVRHTTANSGANPWRVTAEINPDLSSGDDMEIRIIGGFLDDENYLFCEFKYIWDGIESKWVMIFILGEVVAGVESTLAEHPWDQVATLTDDTPPSFQMTLCWDGDQLTGIVPTFVDDEGLLDELDILSVNGITPPGNMAGIGTSSLGGGDVEFIDFAFTLSDVEDCGECESSCCEGISPEEVLVELSGGSGTYTWIGGGAGDLGDIRVTCSDLNATYTLRYDIPQTDEQVGGSTYRTGHGGDGNCRWTLETQFDAEFWNGSAWTACTIGLYINLEKTVAYTQIILQFIRDNQLTGCQLFIVNPNAIYPNSTTIETFRDNDPAPCEDWTDWQTTTQHAAGTACSGLTCRYMAA